MQNMQMFRLITRSLALLFLFWALNDILLLPADFMSVFHYARILRLPLTADSRAVEVHLFRYYGALSAARLIGVAVSLWIGLHLYRGSGWVQRFFGETATETVTR